MSRSGRSDNLTPTNHESVMESGETPELSRSGIQIRIPIEPIVRKIGEGGEEATLGARILALLLLVTRQPDFSGESGPVVLRERGLTRDDAAL